MVNHSQGDQGIDVEQIDHGKVLKISSTSLLLNTGASTPALRTGSPVRGSVTILPARDRLRRGVSTMRPSSILASSGSPGRIPNRRRIGPGRTTGPWEELWSPWS